jgi:hypothetical protein
MEIAPGQRHMYNREGAKESHEDDKRNVDGNLTIKGLSSRD